ncbi:MAG: ferrochelatase [Actinomycetes bacterium]
MTDGLSESQRAIARPGSDKSYDALLLVSFGGPESPDDVLPFLANVTRGRDIPPARLEQVAERYYARDGVSPINQANRDLRGVLADRLDVPVYWGNRNWHPFLADAVREMRADGVGRALAFVTSVFASYSSCRQYLENIADARATVGQGAPAIERVRHGFDHPGFVDAFVDTTVAALQQLPSHLSQNARLLFTAHSIPLRMQRSSGPHGGLYEQQLKAASALVAEGVQARTGIPRPFDVVFQSRSGSPTDPWLEPDLLDAIDAVTEGAVVVVPVGFTADHMEVVYDIDVEAADRARRRGLAFARAGTAGTHPSYVEMIVELVRERTDPSTPRRALSALGPSYDECPTDCCLGTR